MKTLFMNRKITLPIIAVLLLIYGVKGISYAQDVPDDTIVEFADVNLATAIREELGLATGKGVDILKISKVELAKLIELDAGFSEITDLTGLEHATQLLRLFLWPNQISDITPLAKLTNLTWLNLGENKISDITPLAKLTNLTWLNLNRNQISDITPLAKLTNLTTLGLSENPISDVAPLAQLTNLTSLGLSNNPISDVAPLAKLTNLTELNLYRNQISDITPLAKLINLTRLHLSENSISDVAPLAKLTNLTSLGLEENKVGNITPLTQLTNLTWLNLFRNQISDITPLAQMTNLMWLGLNRNQISDITPLTQLTNLTRLHLSVNSISDVAPLAKLANLTSLHLSNNKISNVVPLAQFAKSSLRSLYLQSNLIHDVTPLADLIHLEKLHLVDNPISDTSPLRALLDKNPDLDIDIEVVRASEVPTATEVSATDTTVDISPASVASPAIGQQLEFSLNITGGEAVAGYQATIQFDTTALRYVKSSNSDYLLDDVFFATPVIDGNLVKLNAVSLAGESNGDGTLATLIFEIIAVKASTLTLSDVLLTDSEGTGYVPNLENAQITETQLLKGDVNGDGIVDIRDLVLVASNLGKTGQNAADVNTDGIVDIRDLVLVAGALGTSATAPSLNIQELSPLTAADIKLWLSQAQHLNLKDASSLKGIQVIEQLLIALTPKKTVLLANYPNPFNPETWIPYHLAKDADVTLHIYTVNGTLARTLALGYQAAGMYQSRSRAAYWNGKNKLGESVASGVYFYTLTAGDFSATRKMLILK